MLLTNAFFGTALGNSSLIDILGGVDADHIVLVGTALAGSPLALVPAGSPAGQYALSKLLHGDGEP